MTSNSKPLGVGGHTLDTSGAIALPYMVDKGFCRSNVVTWSDLSPFEQGYVEALLQDANVVVWPAYGSKPPPPSVLDVRFSDLARETLAVILKDCERARALWPETTTTAKNGRWLWIGRADGLYAQNGFPPQTPHLGDDGKVYLRAALSQADQPNRRKE